MLRLVRHAALSVSLVSLSIIALVPSVASTEPVKAGVVTTLEGNVTVSRVALPPQPLKFKDDVFVNDKVVTGDRSIARMLLGGKAVVTVRERSALTITEVPGKATIDLAAGKIAVAVAKDKMKPGELLEIRAANAVAGVRGTVVIAEVSTGSAQLGGSAGPVGTFWVLKGQVEAYLTSRPGNPLLVGALQEFRGGNVANIVPSQMPKILHGLSTGKVPPTANQAPERGVQAGLELANTSSAAAAAGGGANLTGPPLNVTVPILPSNAQLNSPNHPTPQPPPPPPCVLPGCPRSGAGLSAGR